MTFIKKWAVAIITTTVVAASLVGTAPAPAGATPDSHLTRYPYLTDLVGNSVTVNWATDRSAGANEFGYVKWGSSCANLNNTTPSYPKTPLSIGYGAAGTQALEYQWKATIDLGAPGTYCYRVYVRNDAPVVPEIDLLGTDASPSVSTQAPAGSTAPFSFAVLGDWGQVDGAGANSHLDNIMQQIKNSGARFAVSTGDNAYNNGSQEDYGDLQQTSGVPATCTPQVTPCPAVGMSAIFGPTHWTVPGSTIPMFAGIGNHGLMRSDAFHPILQNWPQDKAVSTSGGRYAVDTVSTQYVQNITIPSVWYAVQAGNARVYMLQTAWPDAATANGTAPSPDPGYANDYEAHWKPGAAEYNWLKADLQAHPGGVKLAVFHKPLYSLNSTERSDTFLRNTGPAGGQSLENLLSSNGVRIAFNGHAHIYERNHANGPNSLVTYLTGGGGGNLGPLPASCNTSADPVAQTVAAYALGWSYTTNTGSKCGSDAANVPTPTNINQVHHFLKVTVDGNNVTVAPTDETGATFDVKTYTVTGNPVGNFETMTNASGGVQVTGWAIDPDTTGPVNLQVTVNGAVVGTGTASTARPDIVGAYPAWGPDHGFALTLPTPASGGNVCVSAINVGPGTTTQLGCKVLPAGSNPFGTIDSAAANAGSIQVAGWALDRDTTGPISVHVYVNGAFAGSGTANTSRPDVDAAYPGSGNSHGYSFSVPGTGGTVCAYAINYGAGANTTLGCRTLPSSTPVGNVESVTRATGGIRVGGWALDGDTTGPITIRVYINGAFAGSGTADQPRADVGAAFPGYGDNHGFAFTVPGSGGSVCVYAISTGAGSNSTLGCRNL